MESLPGSLSNRTDPMVSCKSIWQSSDGLITNDMATLGQNVIPQSFVNPTTIMEEYEMESNKLKFMTLEKTTKAHFQVILSSHWVVFG